MIKRIEVHNLNKKYNYDLTFHNDINILTGRNGSGKTTLLKLLWYIISGNIKNTISEMHLDNVMLETDSETFNLIIKEDNKATFSFSSKLDENINIKSQVSKRSLKALLEKIPPFESETIFFPTFRRIEGGFLTESRDFFYGDTEMFRQVHFMSSEIANSRRLSKRNKHQFIASISTNDIVNLLTRKYAEISTEVARIEKEQSDFILQSIENSKGEERDVLNDIKKKQQDTNTEKNRLLKPFTMLSDHIKDIFKDKGIKITDVLTLGETNEAIFSDKLSAGEKQMLSFLCYCIFTENSIIFIDEPELSLHPDWQRTLVPTLMEISNGNQFFIATHSPFIYSKFPDKEIVLNQDKGGE
jgi:predicted ATPase